MVKKSKSTEVANWDDELAKYADQASNMENSVATGNFFGTKGGTLTYNNTPFPNNEMAVVILDSIMEHVYYGDSYDPENPTTPVCFAFGREETEMSPHEVCVKGGHNQCAMCKDCEWNEFGSADVGKGKACKNSRRIAMIPAGKLDKNSFDAYEKPSDFEKTQIAYMRLPVTSVKAYAAFVKQLSSALRKPPFAVFTRVKLVPDSKTIFKVSFEAIEEVPRTLIPALIKRHEEAKNAIEFPYSPFDDSEDENPKKKKKGRKY